jgi:hypothetical protein
MKLKDWIAQQAKQRQTSKAQVIREVSAKSWVTETTVANVSRGMRLALYAKAKAISDATGGEVTVEELCE